MKEFGNERQFGFSVAVGKVPSGANALEAVRQGVHEETLNELAD